MSQNPPPNALNNEAKAIDYSKFIPFATAGLIFLGVSKLLIFYSLFGINILPFLDFSEIVTSFLDGIISLTVGSVLFCLLFFGSTYNYKLEQDKVKKDLIEKTEEDDAVFLSKKLKYLRKRLFIFRAYGIISIIALILCYRNWKMVLITIVVITLVSFLAFFILGIYNKQTPKLIKDVSLIALILIGSEIGIILSTIYEYRLIKHDKKYFGTRIDLNKESIIKDSTHILLSDSSNFYIGQTNKYIFIHHMKDDRTSVYPISSVLKFDIKIKDHKNWLMKLIDD